VDEEGIANSCNDQRLESRSGKSLDDTSSHEGLVGLGGLSDSGSDNHHHGAEKEDWSFTVFSRESTHERTDTSGSKKIVTSEDSDIGDGDVEFSGDDDDGRVEKRTVGGSVQHGSEEKNESVHLFAPLSPVERIVGIFRGLWSENDMSISTGAVLQADGNIGVSSLVVEENCSGNVRELVIFEDT
jgi:hypothetical protein